MSADEALPVAARRPDSRRVIIASSAGTVFEWYDFFIYGALASIIAKHFFAGVNETAGFIFALLTFAAGFAVRPLGALVFGHIGDRTGRKRAFLITITLMGLATVAIGLLPDYAQIGIWAPVLLIVCRLLQGFALGGEYGGAAIYVAEHAPDHKRGWHTSFIQTSAALGLMAALAVILGTRTVMGEAAFQDWGWRLPFLVSLALLVVSIWIRLSLEESPAFQRMKAEGRASQAPFRESFGQWRNLRVVLLALFAIMMAQGVVWYTAYFYAQFFMERVLKIEPATVNTLLIAVTAVSAVTYCFFGWLSDHVGRKPVLLFGMGGAALFFFPAFTFLTEAANPALARAMAQEPVVMVADPDTCSLQFDPVGRAHFSSSCDIAKSALAGAGVPYRNEAAPAGSLAQVRIGAIALDSVEGGSLDAAALRAARADFAERVRGALHEAGYPKTADPAQLNWWAVFAALLVPVVFATALYGPQAAALVELFPTRIRYTALSLPYHIGTGWFGGFLPATAFAIVAATGDIYSGLWYPVIVAALSTVIALFFLPETRHRDIHRIEG